MKIRQGFVSNSSSTAFCIFGTWLEPKTQEEREQIYEKAEELGLYVRSDQGYYGLYIGLEYCDLKDDETGAEFKTRANELLNQVKEGLTGGYTCDGWFDG